MPSDNEFSTFQHQDSLIMIFKRVRPLIITVKLFFSDRKATGSSCKNNVRLTKTNPSPHPSQNGESPSFKLRNRKGEIDMNLPLW